VIGGGVRVESGTASIVYSTLEYSAYGVDLSNVRSGKTFTLNHSELSNNGAGIMASDSRDGVFTITNNTISDNSGYVIGAFYNFAHWTIDNNVISGNGNGNGQLLYFDISQGLSLTNNQITNNQGSVYASGTQGDFIFTDNVVTGNESHYGVYFVGAASGSIVIEDNTVDNNYNNNYYGIYVISQGAADPAINRNKVRNNVGYGIYLETYNNNTPPSIHDNEITGNGNTGLYVSGQAVPSIMGNTIDNNGAGIYVNYDNVNGNGDFALTDNLITNNQGYGVSVNGYAKPVISNNDIYGNTGYALENYTAFALDARNNWWGQEDTDEINTGSNPKALSFIYDGNTNGGAGKVNYAGWLNANTVPEAPTITSIEVEDSALLVRFSPNGDGGYSIIDFTLSCGTDPVTISETKARSPIRISTLENDVSYTCSVMASNLLGNSAASVIVSATPEEIIRSGLNIPLLKAILDAQSAPQ
jgi:hypothetical protein